MLAEFRVKGFKNFEQELVLKLDEVKNYEFNNGAVRNGIVNKALVYGWNASGKTNLGAAILDITISLTDKHYEPRLYTNSQNANTKEPISFYYRFRFEEGTVEYSCLKDGSGRFISEKLIIDGSEVVVCDYKKGSASVKLEGAEQLATDNPDPTLSFTKYVKSNTILKENKINDAFNKLFEFVDSMLLFRSIGDNMFVGLMNKNENIDEAIVEANKLKDFERLLNENGVRCKLRKRVISGRKTIACVFDDEKEILFIDIASSGTKSFALFYYWLLKMEKVSFVFIDEFDAFYHSDLAKAVITKLMEYKNTQAILTTHNTDIMTNDLLRPDCYFLLEDGAINSFANLTDKELRFAHNLQKMYKSGSFYGK